MDRFLDCLTKLLCSEVWSQRDGAANASLGIANIADNFQTGIFCKKGFKKFGSNFAQVGCIQSNARSITIVNPDEPLRCKQHSRMDDCIGLAAQPGNLFAGAFPLGDRFAAGDGFGLQVTQGVLLEMTLNRPE